MFYPLMMLLSNLSQGKNRKSDWTENLLKGLKIKASVKFKYLSFEVVANWND